MLEFNERKNSSTMYLISNYIRNEVDIMLSITNYC